MARQVDKNADQAADQRRRGTITIGGKVFHPVKRTGSLIKQIIELTPDVPEPERDADGKIIEKPPTKDESKEGVDLVYEQLGLLISTDEGEHPETDFLLDELDFEDAQELVQELSPRPPKALDQQGS